MESLSLDNETAWEDYCTLRTFNRAIRNILTRHVTCRDSENCDEKRIQAFHLAFAQLVATLKRMSDFTLLHEVPQRICLTLLAELNSLHVKTVVLENLRELREMVQKEAPAIAVKEFLARNTNRQARWMTCEDCGFGYLRQKKNSRGELYVECQLCYHHQSPNLTLSVRYFVSDKPHPAV